MAVFRALLQPERVFPGSRVATFVYSRLSPTPRELNGRGFSSCVDSSYENDRTMRKYGMEEQNREMKWRNDVFSTHFVCIE